MVLVISGVGTTYQGTTCERFKTLTWTSTGQEVWLTVWELPADITELLCDGARVLGESLKIGCHDGEISLSGRAENFTPVDRARCPTPSVRAPMDDFQPRALTSRSRHPVLQAQLSARGRGRTLWRIDNAAQERVIDQRRVLARHRRGGLAHLLGDLRLPLRVHIRRARRRARRAPRRGGGRGAFDSERARRHRKFESQEELGRLHGCVPIHSRRRRRRRGHAAPMTDLPGLPADAIRPSVATVDQLRAGGAIIWATSDRIDPSGAPQRRRRHRLRHAAQQRPRPLLRRRAGVGARPRGRPAARRLAVPHGAARAQRELAPGGRRAAPRRPGGAARARPLAAADAVPARLGGARRSNPRRRHGDRLRQRAAHRRRRGGDARFARRSAVRGVDGAADLSHINNVGFGAGAVWVLENNNRQRSSVVALDAASGAPRGKFALGGPNCHQINWYRGALVHLLSSVGGIGVLRPPAAPGGAPAAEELWSAGPLYFSKVSRSSTASPTLASRGSRRRRRPRARRARGGAPRASTATRRRPSSSRTISTRARCAGAARCRSPASSTP